MTHEHITLDSDLHFTIDPVSRNITNNGSKIALMQYDHKSERFTFELPRMIEGHDMSLTNEVLVIYENTGTGTSKSTRAINSGYIRLTDLTPTENDMMTLSWEVTQDSTQLAGTLGFQLRFACYGDEEAGLEEYIWHSNKFTNITILPSYDAVQSIVSNYPDAIDEIYKRLSDVEDSQEATAINTTAQLNEFSDRLARVESTTPGTGGSGTIELDTTLTIAGMAADAKAVGDRLANLEYEPIEIKRLVIECDPTADYEIDSTATAEVGNTIVNVTLKWTLNKPATRIKFSGAASAVSTSGVDGERTFTGPWDALGPHTFTVTVTDERGATASKNATLSFLNGVYYGCLADDGNSLKEADIHGMTKTLSNSRARTFTAIANEGEYVYYCLPMRLGEPEFTVGGFTGGFMFLDSWEFENESGYTEEYYIYRSVNPSLGAVTVTVK